MELLLFGLLGLGAAAIVVRATVDYIKTRRRIRAIDERLNALRPRLK